MNGSNSAMSQQTAMQIGSIQAQAVPVSLERETTDLQDALGGLEKEIDMLAAALQSVSLPATPSDGSWAEDQELPPALSNVRVARGRVLRLTTFCMEVHARLAL